LFRAENRLPSFGQRLKTEREKRAITLEQISSSTKIGTRMLQAIEDENFDQLPGGVFNKGFVRSYARHVGLNEDQTVADYLEAIGEGPSSLAEQKLEIAVPSSAPATRPQIAWGWLAGGLLAMSLAFWLWNRWHHPAELASLRAVTSEKSVQQIENAAARLPVPPPAIVVEHPPSPKNESGSNPAPLATVAPAGTFTVVILARDDCWLSISVDGQPAVEEILTGENQHAIHARNEAIIKAGNVGALDFIFNGQKLSSQGDYGEVKTLSFGPSGLQKKASVAPSAVH
jgi:cytoskeleton protein RodZ